MSDSFLFGTVGSPISTPAKPGGSVSAVLRIAELGLEALELGWVQAVRVSEETCLAIRKAAQEHLISISVHAPYFINLNADEGEWPKSRKRLMDAAYYGYLAGATDIVFHPGSYFGKSSELVLPLVIRRLQECVSELRANGNPVILRPETMGKPALLGSFEDVIEMSRSVPGVLPCLDFAHLHARVGDGSMNTFDEWLGLLNGYAKLLGEDSLSKLHIHLSGIAYNSKGEQKHLTIPESDLNLIALLKALRHRNCAGRILCESPTLETDALYLKQAWLEIQ